jgi:hypothetical protein
MDHVTSISLYACVIFSKLYSQRKNHFKTDDAAPLSSRAIYNTQSIVAGSVVCTASCFPFSITRRA